MVFFFSFWFYERGSCCVAQASMELADVAQAGLKLTILLSLPPKVHHHTWLEVLENRSAK
jgi:hypothetical protein